MALGKTADLYVLDEPLANLDVGAEAAAMEKIMQVTKGRTLVMIMHGGLEYRNLFDEVRDLELPAASVDQDEEL